MKENRNSALKFITLPGVITLTVSKPHYNQMGAGLAFENPCTCHFSWLSFYFLLLILKVEMDASQIEMVEIFFFFVPSISCMQTYEV